MDLDFKDLIINDVCLQEICLQIYFSFNKGYFVKSQMIIQVVGGVGLVFLELDISSSFLGNCFEWFVVKIEM